MNFSIKLHQILVSLDMIFQISIVNVSYVFITIWSVRLLRWSLALIFLSGYFQWTLIIQGALFRLIYFIRCSFFQELELRCYFFEFNYCLQTHPPQLLSSLSSNSNFFFWQSNSKLFFCVMNVLYQTKSLLLCIISNGYIHIFSYLKFSFLS